MSDEIKRVKNADKIMKIPISYEEKGKAERIKEVALKMLKKGSSIEFIADVTGLDHKEIKTLKEGF